MRRSFLIGGFWAIMSSLSFGGTTEELPPGVPNPLGPDGKYTHAMGFTTKAYQAEAFRLMLREANHVAKELGLQQKLPIAEADVVRAFISPFGDAWVNRRIGNITTADYGYGFAADNKFNDVHKTHLDETCFEYRAKYQLPIKQVDTNGAYRLATQFLAAVRVDVKSLDRECQAHIKPSDFWNGVAHGAHLKGKTFVPIYDIYWLAPNRPETLAHVGYVQVFLPTSEVLQLHIDDAKYILRNPLVFTNLAVLLSTNVPIPTDTRRPATNHSNVPGAN